MEQTFWFKIIKTKHSRKISVNLNWTITEFLTNIKPMIFQRFTSELQGLSIDILDNFSHLKEDDLLIQCLDNEEQTLLEKYGVNIKNLAFYIRVRD